MAIGAWARRARTRPGAARQPRGSSGRAWSASASAAHGASNAPTGVRSRSRPPPHRPPTSGLGLSTQHWHQHMPAPGRRLLASPAVPASEPGVVRHLRLTELSMHSSLPCDKQRHARDENRERQQRRQIVCASGHGHPHGVPRAPTDRPSGYSSPMDPRHHPGSSGARSGAALRCLTVRVGAPLNSAGQRLPPLLTSGRLVAHTLCDGKSAHGRARAQRQQEKSSRVKRERTRAEDGARASRTCGAQSHARAAHRATHVRARVKLVRRTYSYVRRKTGERAAHEGLRLNSVFAV